MSFYSTNYGIETPYNVLLDGTFCKAALKFKLNISEQLCKYLEGEVKLSTTRCVLEELEAHGKNILLSKCAGERTTHGPHEI